MRSFKHINAQSVEEAAALLKQYGESAHLSAGGTDIVGEMKDNILPEYPEVVVSIANVEGLDYIKENNGVIHIGAMAILEDIADSDLINEKIPAVAEAAHSVASPHIRAMGTISGNLCQENRCWYYRNQDNKFNCLRKGGTECYALVGENQYHSIFGAGKIEATPCTSGCPTNTDIPAYMNKIRKGDIEGAAKILMAYNPIPCMTGRVCPHTCQDDCCRCTYDDGVSVREVERYLGDYALAHKDIFYPAPVKENGAKVAIVGSGPAGLSAAYYLRKAGCQVTVFDKNEKPGGVLMYGIPQYRLDKAVVQDLIDAIEGMGVTFATGVEVGKSVTVEQLQKNNDAVFIGQGTWIDNELGIEGEELTQSCMEFLQKFNTGDRTCPGAKVAIVGGGNAAMDAARTVLRLGGKPVVLYRRGREEMPAIKHDVDIAFEEGIEFRFLTQPVKATGKLGAIELTCIRMELADPEKPGGRRKSVPVEGSEFTDTFDAVIKGIGQKSDMSLVPAEYLTEKKRFINATEMEAAVADNLFAGGDAVTGPATVVKALAAGRRASTDILIKLGKNFHVPPFENADLGLHGGAVLGEQAPVVPEGMPMAEAVKNTDKEEFQTIDIEKVKYEANRCLNCGCVAVSQQDMAPALIALGAIIKTTKRDIPAEYFFTVKRFKSVVLDSDEIVTEILIPEPEQASRVTYLKFAARTSVDFPMVGVAANCGLNADGTVKYARLVLNGVAPVPVVLEKACEALIGKAPSEEVFAEVADIALQCAQALEKNAYKIPMAKGMIKKALRKVLA